MRFYKERWDGELTGGKQQLNVSYETFPLGNGFSIRFLSAYFRKVGKKHEQYFEEILWVSFCSSNLRFEYPPVSSGQISNLASFCCFFPKSNIIFYNIKNNRMLLLLLFTKEGFWWNFFQKFPVWRSQYYLDYQFEERELRIQYWFIKNKMMIGGNNDWLERCRCNFDDKMIDGWIQINYWQRCRCIFQLVSACQAN